MVALGVMDRVNFEFLQSCLGVALPGQLVLNRSIPVQMPVGQRLGQVVVVRSGRFSQQPKWSQLGVVEGLGSKGAFRFLSVVHDRFY